MHIGEAMKLEIIEKLQGELKAKENEIKALLRIIKRIEPGGTCKYDCCCPPPFYNCDDCEKWELLESLLTEENE